MEFEDIIRKRTQVRKFSDMEINNGRKNWAIQTISWRK